MPKTPPAPVGPTTPATPVTGGLQTIMTTTPLAKRPIGDLYPVSTIMLSPEELASRASLERGITMRRGGLAAFKR